MGEGAVAGVLDKIGLREGKTRAKNVQLYLDAQRRGIPPRMSHNVLDQTRATAHAYGLCATSPRLVGASYLDFGSGLQVIEGA